MDTIVTPVTVITLDSTRIVHSIKADLVARYFPPVVRLVQYDQSLPVIAVSLMQNGQAYTLPNGAAANIRVHKPDATYVYNPALGCDSTRNIVYFEVTQAMAAANGDGLAIVEIVVDGDIAGTSLITLHFEENPVPEDAIESSDEWETIYELCERIIAATVTPVSTAAGMTDHNVVYLYTGTETGWNQGHMYYYNGTTWVDAGIAVTDTTLSVSGLAADAKATGDRFNSLDAGDIEYDDSETYSSGTVGDALTDLEEETTSLKEEYTQILDSAYVTDTASGSIASFSDGADGVPVKSLTVNIEPAQSGSGDPSPDNVRPISGHTQAVVTVSPTTDAQDGTSVTISLNGTRYGGTLDVGTGVLTVDRVYKELSSNIPWQKSSSYSGGFYSPRVNFTVDGHEIKVFTPFMCSHAKSVTALSQYVSGTCFMDNSVNLRIMDANTTVEQWGEYLDAQKTAETPISCCFYLENPFTVQLSANEVSTVLGQNNIWSDAGDVEVEYRADTKLYIQKVMSS